MNSPARPLDARTWSELRALFPAARRCAFLNTATYGPGPQPVVDAVKEFLDVWSDGSGAWPDWEESAEASRRSFAKLLGIDPGTVALASGMAAAAAQVAEGLEPAAAANVVVGEGEFRSNLFPWLNQERRGFEVRLVPFVEGRLEAERVLESVDERTAVVAVSHVQSSNGYRIDVPALARGCRERDARLFLDATQSAGALRVPLDGVDFLAATAYKWMLSPRGSAFLYVAPEHVHSMPPSQPSWKTPQDPHASYYGPPLELADDASRYDVSLAWPAWVGTERALELLLEVGIDAIEERNLALARRFREGLPALGLSPLFDEADSSQVVGLRVPDPDAVQAALGRADVVAAVRGEYLRVSFHFFNDESDVDRALAALGEA